MRKTCSFILLFSLTAPAWGAQKAYFIILQEGFSTVDTAREIQELRGAVQLHVPPRTISAILPDSVNISQLNNIQEVFTGIIPIESLNPLGPLAVSAGQEWNRTRATESRLAGKMSFSAVKSQLGQQFISEPKNIQTEQSGAVISARWNTIWGAGLYEIQMASDPHFSNLLAESLTENAQIDLPLPAGVSGEVFLRVRGIEKLRTDKTFEDVPGKWATTVLNSNSTVFALEQSPPPLLTSPLDESETEGANLTLEWMSNTPHPKRLQISEHADFSPTLIDQVIHGSEYTVPSASLHLGKTYRWRVREWSPEHPSPWSNARLFKVTEPRHIEGDMMVNPEAPR